MTQTVMATKTKPDIDTMMQRIAKWSGKLHLQKSAEGDSIIATAKYIDVDADDLHALSAIIGDDYKITFGRSGANFRMIIW
jgi:hypothetical protein